MSGKTILLVEDEQSVRNLASRVLQRGGYHVLEAGSGTDAIALVGSRADGIELLITDLVLPGMGGPELARTLAETQPRLRVLFMSGYPDAEMDGGSAGLRGAAFLGKPFLPADLLDKVETLLSPS